MFLNKFRNRYSFNFLSVFGWIIFVLLCVFFIPIICSPYSGFPGIALFFIFLLILGLNILFYLITFFVYFFETVNFKKITNTKFLNNKYIKIIQTLGIIFAFLPFLILICIFI